ncbi:thioredoxin-like protein [Sparassis latifolia]|uniref:Thioredoxin domain-containing protein, mitochondrial n=1 Tax=Sparassis crispa TaxID=139825 RepID=A0A401GX22_9APHY|nr:Thioredoxin domain-containing protein, mitochondrial [Sparassis crispa]GBE86733.1 Thioredoxin domain-containing protein, mitochondrial [Sparassis crispa]
MRLPWVVLTFAFAPSMVSAALFPADTKVKMLDANSFRKAMKQNMTSVVAFVAPWCGHCQRMAPEFSKAAVALTPMVPLYAVDCDDEANKRLCAEQGVQGFPTVKLFPRGGQSRAVSFDSNERTSKAFFYWASKNIPHAVRRLDTVTNINDWVEDNITKPSAILLHPGKEIPLMWKSLGNKYKDAISFAIHRDKTGKSAVKLGAEDHASKASRILVYPPGSTEFVRYDGTQKFQQVSKFFDSIVDGTADFMVPKETEAEEPTPEAQPDHNDQVPFEAAQAPSSQVEREPAPAATPAAESTLLNEPATEMERAKSKISEGAKSETTERAKGETTELPVEETPIAIEETVTTGNQSRVKDEL